MTSWKPLVLFAGLMRSSTTDHTVVEQHPLGFANVRADAGSREPVAARRHPIGFAPPTVTPPAHEPVFRTELSFRHFSRTVVLGSSDELSGSGELQTGQAGFTAYPEDPESDAAPSDVVDNRDEADVTAVVPEPDEPIEEVAPTSETRPFFMREMSFRRKSKNDGSAELPAPETPDVTATQGPPLEVLSDANSEPDSAQEQKKVPFYKREITLGRKREAETTLGAALAAATVEDEPEQPALEVPTMPHAEAATETEAIEQVPVAAATDEVEADPPVEETAAEPADDEVTATEPMSHPADEVEAENVIASGSDERKSDTKRIPRPSIMPTLSRPGRSGQRTVGVKIEAASINVAVVDQADGVNELVQLVHRPLAAGIFTDGEVRDVSALADALSSIWAENKLPRRGVRLGLFGSRVGVRVVDIVGVEEGERFANAVRFKAHEVLPIGVQDSVFDYRVLTEQPNESGELIRHTLLVVAPREQVLPFVDAFRQARIGLQAVDLDALGLLRAFVDPRIQGAAADDRASVVVSMGRDGSTLLVAGGGVAEFTRSFDLGGIALIDAVAQELDLSPEAAEATVAALTRSGAAGQMPDGEDATRVLSLVRSRLMPFARELVASLQFYQQQPGSLGISDIVVTGALADIPGIADTLHQLIGVGVRIGDPLARLVVRTPFEPEDDWTLSAMAAPIGLAIRDLPMREVDLIPPEQRVNVRRRPRLAPVLVPAAVAIPLVAVGFMYFSARGDVNSRHSQLEVAQAELATLPQPAVQVDPALTGAQAIRATAVAGLLGQRLAWDSVLGDVARVLPKDVWLSNFTATMPDAATAAATGQTAAVTTGTVPQAVTFDGHTYDYESLANLMSRLSVVPSLSNVQLTGSTVETTARPNGKDLHLVHFTIAADLNQTGGTR